MFKLHTNLSLPKFVESPLCASDAEDWSRVRSPSRARRRLKRGFPQNVRRYRKPACFFVAAENTYYIHPELMKALRRKTAEAGDRMYEAAVSNLMFGSK